MPENAGNTIHAKAPFEMFPQESIFYKDPRFTSGILGDFATYVNNHCSHLIVTLANFIRFGSDSGEKYLRFKEFLEQFSVPIVIFGLGAQSKTQDLSGELPYEALELMKYLADSSEAVGVRGHFTASVFEHFAGVKNTYVTACPSFFSRPRAFSELSYRVGAEVDVNTIAFNGTTYHDPIEKELLVSAIQRRHYLVEPVNRFTTRFAEQVRGHAEQPDLPWFLKGPVKNGTLSREQIIAFFRDKFYLFREPAPWYRFNEQHVSFTYGTRFHVNMASLLSGVPALWITHDSRTQELTDFLSLPRITKEEAVDLSLDELVDRVDYSDMFRALPGLFENFNRYLALHDLPAITQPLQSGSGNGSGSARPRL